MGIYNLDGTIGSAMCKLHKDFQNLNLNFPLINSFANDKMDDLLNDIYLYITKSESEVIKSMQDNNEI